MGQVTIYLEDEIEKKMTKAAKSMRLSKSRWIARLIQEKIADEWPRSVVELAGAWSDFPDLETVRSDLGEEEIRDDL